MGGGLKDGTHRIHEDIELKQYGWRIRGRILYRDQPSDGLVFNKSFYFEGILRSDLLTARIAISAIQAPSRWRSSGTATYFRVATHGTTRTPLKFEEEITVGSERSKRHLTNVRRQQNGQRRSRLAREVIEIPQI